MRESLQHYPGNHEVIQGLEQLLAIARQGKTSYIAATMIDMDGHVTAASMGSHLFEDTSLRSLFKLIELIVSQRSLRTAPAADPSLGADYVRYNVVANPMSYDFVWWLANAEATRRREGAPAPLKVGFWFGGINAFDGPEGPMRRQQFEGIVRPMLALMGAVEDTRALSGRSPEFVITKDLIAAAQRGEMPPKFNACMRAMSGMLHWLNGANYPVTITLREADHWPHRNSNLEAWKQFGRWLELRGEHVVFVRDTAKAHEPLLNLLTCPQASTDLHYRMALYEQAKCNLFVSNGPMGLCMLSDAPYLIFQPIEGDDSPYWPNRPSYWRTAIGMEPGGQLPWARPDQRFVWAKDDYDNLVAAWDDFTRTAKAA